MYRWYIWPLKHFSLARTCILKRRRSDFSMLYGGKMQLYNVVWIKKLQAIVLALLPGIGCMFRNDAGSFCAAPWCVLAGACLSDGPVPHVPCSLCCDPLGPVPPCVSLESREPHSSLSYILAELAIRHSTARPAHPAPWGCLTGTFLFP